MESKSTYTTSQNIDELIMRAKKEMESAAKELKFKDAAEWRDEMHRLQKLKEESLK
jgi:excinuclease ABC subunit B